MTDRDGHTAPEPTPQPPAPLNAPGFAPVSKADLRRTRSLAAGLLVLADRATVEELENLGIKPEDLDDVRSILEQQTRPLPTARNMALAAMSGVVEKEYVLTGHARALRGMHALAPLIVLRLAEKIDNDQAPGSVRVLLEVAKGIGLLVPAEPVAPAKRASLLDLEELRQRPASDLKALVLRQSA